MNIKCRFFWFAYGVYCVFSGFQKTSAVLRVVRSTNNSSKHINGFLEPDIITEQTTGADYCRNEDDTNSSKDEEQKERQRRADREKTATAPSATSNSTEIDISRFSGEFLKCLHTQVEPGCYNKLDNGSVIVPLYNRLFNITDYTIDQDGVLFVCPTFFPEGDKDKFATAITIISIVGTAISTVCIILHMSMFFFLEKLRNLPGYCLYSLCIALLFAYITNYIQASLHETLNCFYIGLSTFYFYLASMFWMNVMSYDVWRSLRRATTKLRLSGDRPMLIRFAMYSTYAWGGPLLIVIIALIVDSATDNQKYKLIFRIDNCWFQHKQGLFLYFALPLITLLILNVALFISSFYMISRATMNTAENKADLSSRFFISLRLAVVMGLMWIFGVLAPATQVVVFWYFSAICNALQGVFIFFSFTFTERTRKECRNALQRKKSSFVPTQISST